MMSIVESLVIAFAVVSSLTVMFSFVIVMRYFKYKEQKAIAEANGRFQQKEAQNG